MWTASNNIYWLSNITGGNGQSYLLPINNSHCQAQTVFVSSKKLCCCNLFDRDQSPNTVMATFFPPLEPDTATNQGCYYVLAPRRSQQQHPAQKAEVARSEVTFHLQQGRQHNTSNTHGTFHGNIQCSAKESIRCENSIVLSRDALSTALATDLYLPAVLPHPTAQLHQAPAETNEQSGSWAHARARSPSIEWARGDW